MPLPQYNIETDKPTIKEPELVWAWADKASPTKYRVVIMYGESNTKARIIVEKAATTAALGEDVWRPEDIVVPEPLLEEFVKLVSENPDILKS